ncbi:MAG: hypothetical protein JXA73_21140 [Acidobacteria bacterium]|nr:hypothetical protein [Acidobacteriota bacterium]
MADLDEIRQHMQQFSNEELISILLKHDENQWRPEVFDIVGAILSERGVSSGKDLKYAVGPGSAFEETEGLNLMTVAEYVSHLDAEADRLILEGEGVKAWIFEDDTPPAEGVPPTVQLKVFAEDWKAAMERLVFDDGLPPILQDDVAEPPCPRCGSRRIVEESEMVDNLSESGKLSPKQECFYRCFSCGHKWSEPR